jgi:hypothetical protein
MVHVNHVSTDTRTFQKKKHSKIRGKPDISRSKIAFRGRNQLNAAPLIDAKMVNRDQVNHHEP